jgi:hypothetical protein
MEKYYIDDTQWWYSINGSYDMAKIADILVLNDAKKVNHKKKFGWKNFLI